MNLNKSLPLTETTYYILLSLVKPLHGYAIMQNVEQLSKGKVKIAAGTLYGAIDNLLTQGFISLDNSIGRRKSYKLTNKGRNLLYLEYGRISELSQISKEILKNEEL